MKAGKEHRVPLSPAAVAIIKDMPSRGEFVFAGNAPLDDKTLYRLVGPMRLTVHGFRSSFRDLAAEQTSVAREVVEAALAHRVEDKTEEAYRRSDLFDKRRDLMDAWARFCIGQGVADVVQLRAATRS
jgi:integrase